MPQVKHPLIPPKKIEEKALIDKFLERTEKTGDILSLSKEEYRKSMEEKLVSLTKEVHSFKAIADVIIATKERFWISAITARVVDREKHMVAELSSNLGDNPVFVTPIDYDGIDNEYIYNIFLPASEEILDKCGHDPNRIAIEQLKIIKNTFDNLSKEYKENLKHITLDREEPAPKIKIFRRDGTWTVWRVKIKCLDDFWSHSMSESVYSRKQPFLATAKYEFAMLVSDDAYKLQFDEIRKRMVKHAEAKEIHSIELNKEEEIEISYAWLVRFLGRDELRKKKEEICSSLKEQAPRVGSGIPKAIIGEEEPMCDNIEIILDQPTSIRYPNFMYSKETYERCILKKSDLE